MLPGKTSLKINAVRRFDRGVGAEFDGGSLNEIACRHDHIAVVSRHRVGFRRHIAVYRRTGLNPLTKSDDPFRGSQCHSLDDVMALFCRAGTGSETKPLVEMGRKNSGF